MPTRVYAIFYAAGVIGGVLLVVGSFVGAGRLAPRWTRTALRISGPACVLWGVLGYILLRGVRDPYGYVQLKGVFGGIAIGILVLLFASGEFRSSPKSDANQV